MTSPLDCHDLPADTVKRYYDQRIWLLLPFDKYEKFIRWVRGNRDPGVMDHDWNTTEKGVLIRKRNIQ